MSAPTLTRGVRATPAGGSEKPRPRGPAPASPTASVLMSALTMVSLICLWVAAQVLFLGGLSQSRDQELLYRDFRTQLAGATAPIGPVVPVGDPVAVLTIPHLGLSQVVVEGTASGDLLSGPGHRRDTPLPGQEGVSVVYGRGASYGAPFKNIAQLSRGDQINVVMAQGEARFKVIGVRRAGDELPQPVQPGVARLTLVGALGSGTWSSITPNEAVYVDAEAPKAFPAPAGRPLAIPPSEQPMQGDPTAFTALALVLGLLVALSAAVTIARRRWSVILVWVVASPVAVALAWQATDLAMRLLPNLL